MSKQKKTPTRKDCHAKRALKTAIKPKNLTTQIFVVYKTQDKHKLRQTPNK